MGGRGEKQESEIPDLLVSRLSGPLFPWLEQCVESEGDAQSPAKVMGDRETTDQICPYGDRCSCGRDESRGGREGRGPRLRSHGGGEWKDEERNRKWEYSFHGCQAWVRHG